MIRIVLLPLAQLVAVRALRMLIRDEEWETIDKTWGRR